MFAFEAWTRLHSPEDALGDFEYGVEMCISARTMYQYHDHPRAPDMARRIFGQA